MADHFHADLQGDHDHPDPLAVNLRRVGWQHNHVHDTSGLGRADDNVLHTAGIYHNDFPAGATLVTSVLIRTVNAWDDDGKLIRPCQFGNHGNMKYNVVQLHHKDPVGLGGPEVNLNYERDCGWDGNLPGLGACGLHHDDTHLLWRMAAKVLRPGENWHTLVGWRRMFGRYVLKAVQHGWDMRVQRLDAEGEPS